MTETNANKDHVLKRNIVGFLLLLRIEKLVHGAVVPITPHHIEVSSGSASTIAPATTISSIKHHTLDKNLKEMSKDSQWYERQNQWIDNNLKNPNPSTNEEYHQETNLIRKLLSYDNYISDPPSQSHSAAPAPGRSMALKKKHDYSWKITAGYIAALIGTVLVTILIKRMSQKAPDNPTGIPQA